MPSAELIRAVLETRATIGVDASRRCAERAGAAERRGIADTAQTTAAAIGSDDAALDLGYEELWRLIVVGAGNIAYRLALNSLVGGVQRYSEIASALRPSRPELVRALGAAIEAGEGEEAARAASALLEPDVEAVN